MPACMLLGGLWGLRMPLQWHTFIRMLAQAPATPPPEESKASAARRAGLRRGPASQTHFHTAALPQWQQRCGRSSAAHPLQAGRWQMADGRATSAAEWAAGQALQGTGCRCRFLTSAGSAVLTLSERSPAAQVERSLASRAGTQRRRCLPHKLLCPGCQAASSCGRSGGWHRRTSASLADTTGSRLPGEVVRHNECCHSAAARAPTPRPS
jgi:hypothetical protein